MVPLAIVWIFTFCLRKPTRAWRFSSSALNASFWVVGSRASRRASRASSRIARFFWRPLTASTSPPISRASSASSWRASGPASTTARRPACPVASWGTSIASAISRACLSYPEPSAFLRACACSARRPMNASRSSFTGIAASSMTSFAVRPDGPICLNKRNSGLNVSAAARAAALIGAPTLVAARKTGSPLTSVAALPVNGIVAWSKARSPPAACPASVGASFAVRAVARPFGVSPPNVANVSGSVATSPTNCSTPPPIFCAVVSTPVSRNNISFRTLPPPCLRMSHSKGLSARRASRPSPCIRLPTA